MKKYLFCFMFWFMGIVTFGSGNDESGFLSNDEKSDEASQFSPNEFVVFDETDSDDEDALVDNGAREKSLCKSSPGESFGKFKNKLRKLKKWGRRTALKLDRTLEDLTREQEKNHERAKKIFRLRQQRKYDQSTMQCLEAKRRQDGDVIFALANGITDLLDEKKTLVIQLGETKATLQATEAILLEKNKTDAEKSIKARKNYEEWNPDFHK